MATVTLSSANLGQAEAVHAGVNCGVYKVSISATASLDSVWRIGKIPHGAIPLEAIWYPGPAAPATFVTRFGISASTELFFASDSWAETQTNYRTARRLGSPFQVSLSDADMPRFEYVTMGGGVGIDISVGHMGDLVVFYKLPTQGF